MRSVKIILLVFILVFFSLSSFSGNRTQLDSMLRIIPSAVNDTNKVHLFQKVSIKYRNQGELDSSLLYAEKAIYLSDSLNFKVGFMNANQAMGNTLLAQGNYNAALRSFLTTLKVAEETNNLKGKATSCLNIGNVYYFLYQFDKALDYFMKSLKYKIELKDTKGLAFVYNNIGDTYRLLGNKNEALIYLNKALKLWEESGNKKGKAQSLTNLGIILLTDKNFEEAEKNFTEVYNICKELDDVEGLCASIAQLGVLYFDLGKYQKAEKFFLESLKMANEIGFLERISFANQKLSEIYKLTGKDALALDYYKSYIKANDSIRNSEITKKTTIQEMEFKFEQKQALLRIEQEKKDALANSELMYQKKQRNYFIAGFALMILLAFFILWGYIQKRKSNIELADKNETIQKQKVILEEKQKEIIDSINYAKRIQYTLLAHDEFLKENLPEHFIYFHPKDIVSGDFYWATRHGDKFYLAVCDSTGHGVPGAFMSLLNIGFLSEAINEKGIEKPNEVFDFVRQKLTLTISQEGQKDGFDGVLICFDRKQNTITYAAANNAPVLMHKNETKLLQDDRMPVGIGERNDKFNLYSIDALKGDMLYLYTDGFADQFGGPKGKKFMYRQLNELLVSNRDKPLQEQKVLLKSAFENWKGHLEQVDDVCVIGIKI